MNGLLQRQLVGFFCFALVAVVIGLGPLDAVFCLLAAAGSYLGTARLQQRRLDRLTDRHFERAQLQRERNRSTPTTALRKANSA